MEILILGDTSLSYDECSYDCGCDAECTDSGYCDSDSDVSCDCDDPFEE